MVLKLIALIVTTAVVLTVPGSGVGFLLWRLYKVRAKTRRDRLVLHNFRSFPGRHELVFPERSLVIMSCKFCYKHCNPDTDCYDRAHGWYHASCLAALFG